MEDYEAFKGDDKKQRTSIELRKANGELFWLKYIDRHLMRLSWDRKTLVIFAYSLNIIITGRNLLELARAIDNEFCAWVQEYNPALWNKPDAVAAFIEKIEIYKPEGDGKSDDDPEARH